MDKKKKLGNEGLSLIELLICLVIASIVILAAYSFVMIGTNSYNSTSKTADLQQEVTYSNNLIREAVIAGKKDLTCVVYSNNGNVVELHTGSKVIYYDKANKNLCIYNEGDTYGSDIDLHLITKYATNFSVEFADTGSGLSTETTDSDGNGTINASSKLVKVTIDYELKGKKDTTQNVYEIRNNS